MFTVCVTTSFVVEDEFVTTLVVDVVTTGVPFTLVVEPSEYVVTVTGVVVVVTVRGVVTVVVVVIGVVVLLTVVIGVAPTTVVVLKTVIVVGALVAASLKLLVYDVTPAVEVETVTANPLDEAEVVDA